MSQVPPEQIGSTIQPDRKATFMTWMEKSQQITAGWLYELGGWIFGGLIATAIMLLPVLISLGFADRATLIAALTLAIALPFDLAGLGVVRYFRDLVQVTEAARTLLARNAGEDEPTIIKLKEDSEALTPAKRKVMDSTASLILAMSMLFTLISIGSALWRVSWVVTLLFLIAGIVGVWLVIRVIRYSA